MVLLHIAGSRRLQVPVRQRQVQRIPLFPRDAKRVIVYPEAAGVRHIMREDVMRDILGIGEGELSVLTGRGCITRHADIVFSLNARHVDRPIRSDLNPCIQTRENA